MRALSATALPARSLSRWAIVVVIALLTIWTLGLSHVIQLPLALVWILPFTCIIIGAFAVLWEGGAFDG
jgi:hypothetical protein